MTTRLRLCHPSIKTADSTAWGTSTVPSAVKGLSGSGDLNPGPHGPEPCALAICATPRRQNLLYPFPHKTQIRRRCNSTDIRFLCSSTFAPSGEPGFCRGLRHNTAVSSKPPLGKAALGHAITASGQMPGLVQHRRGMPIQHPVNPLHPVYTKTSRCRPVRRAPSAPTKRRAGRRAHSKVRSGPRPAPWPIPGQRPRAPC
jgi:hypothetical protein